MEKDEKNLPSEYKQWMSFAKQKLAEVSLLKDLFKEEISDQAQKQLFLNKQLTTSQQADEVYIEIFIPFAASCGEYNPLDPRLRSGSVRLNNFVSQNYSLTDLIQKFCVC